MSTQERSRREFLTTVGLGAASLALPGEMAGAAQGSSKPPNVVLVMTDDQGYGDLGCHGNAAVRTPHIDRLYGQSTRLQNFHVDPTCAPTRSALMTGRYSVRTGVWHTVMGRSFLRRDEVTMADVFRASGYRTAIFGKWGLGGNRPFLPQDRGFEEVLVSGDDGNCHVGDYWGNNRFHDVLFHNGKPEKSKGFCTDVLFDHALDFIEKHKDRPFFVYLPTNAAHGPLYIPEKYVDMYRGTAGESEGAFYGTITKIDENMGRLMAHLDKLGLEDNTVLIFMTDNGTAGGGFNAGMRGRKGSEYEGGHRVPFFIRWPGGGISAGRDIDRLSAHIDVLPTLIELCGLQHPDEVRFDGVSLGHMFKGEAGSSPARTLVIDSQRIEHPRKWKQSSVMTQRWRLINGQELYDMQNDPGQRTSVAAEHPEVASKLRRDYEAWWASVSRRFGEYCEIEIGGEGGNPFPITCHDWHAPINQIPWAPNHILDALEGNGFWAINVARPGRYAFSLRRWPLEVNKLIRGTLPGGKALLITTARLKIGSIDESLPVQEDAVAVNFEINLSAGKTRMQTWFTDETGASRGAYYVYVKRLGG